MYKPYLSVVVPAYNEEKNLIIGVLTEIFGYLSKQNYSWEVIVVDDGSTDKTRRILSEFRIKNLKLQILEKPHRGKAGAIMSGIRASGGEHILVTDFDQSTPVFEVEKMLPKFEQGFEVVIGSRLERKNSPMMRRITGWGFKQLQTLLLGLPFSDTQCGFKMFRRSAIAKILKKMKTGKYLQKRSGAYYGVAFDLEVLTLAKNLGYKVAEVPVNWQYREGSNANLLKSSWVALTDIVRVRFTKYD